MKLEGIMLSKVSKTKGDKYCMITYMNDLKKPKSEKERVPEVGEIEEIGRYC